MKRKVTLPGGEAVSALGQGTWMMAEGRGRRADEIAALREGLDLGLTLIDTAEMYGEGESEKLIGEAIAGRRDEAFLVSKVYPHNASRSGVVAACERSLKRLRTDRLDLYLLHWQGSHPLEDTIAGFEALRRAGKIRHWGVSNFDADDMIDLVETEDGGACAVNQVLYNLTRRGPEFDLTPWQAARGIPVMAYSPIEQGGIPRAPQLVEVARRHGATIWQIALAWVLRRPDVIAIPKAGKADHVRENAKALDIALSADDLALIDAAFPPPRRKIALEML